MQGTTLLGWVIGVTIAAGALIDGWVRAPTVAERWAAAIGLGHAADQAPFLAREFRRRLLIRRTGMIVGTLTMLALQPQRHFAHLVNPVNGYVLGVLVAARPHRSVSGHRRLAAVQLRSVGTFVGHRARRWLYAALVVAVVGQAVDVVLRPADSLPAAIAWHLALVAVPLLTAWAAERVASLPVPAGDGAELGLAWALRTSDVRALWGIAGYLALALPIFLAGWTALLLLPLAFFAYGFLISGLRPPTVRQRQRPRPPATIGLAL